MKAKGCMFTTYDQRRRAQDFDSLVEAAGHYLSLPALQDSLGAAAMGIRSIHDHAVLPNVRHGQLELPHNYKADADAVYVVPVGREEMIMVGLGRLTANVDMLDVVRPLPDYMEVPGHGEIETVALLEDVVLAHPVSDWPLDPQPKQSARRPKVWARTYQEVGLEEDPWSFMTCPPLVFVANKVAKRHSAVRAGVMVHEYMHVRDMYTLGPLLFDTKVATANELNAYEGTLLAYPYAPWPARLHGAFTAAKQVRQLKYRYGDFTQPAALSPRLIEEMGGMVHIKG